MERFLKSIHYLCKNPMLMRNRPDISYLTLLGLSLSVVIAMQKGDSCEDRVRFKLSDADGHHICFLSADAIRDAFLAVSHDKSSFVFGYNAPSYPVLTSPLKALVDVKGLCFLETIPLAELDYKESARDKTLDLSSLPAPIGSSVNSLDNRLLSACKQSVLYASQHSSAFPVRAGPELTI